MIWIILILSFLLILAIIFFLRNVSNFITPKKKQKLTGGEETKSFNSTHKLLIRDKWNKSIIRFLSKNEKQKLIYLGLPSTAAEDILTWLDYIDEIIAFQCRIYGKPSSPSQERDSIEKLDELLRKLERSSKINGYVLYDGYLEEVILKGYDNSPKSINFSVSKVVTLYNLDFCNKISSPIEYVNKKGLLKKAYKFQAISKLLELQRNLISESEKFLLFLTVHCSYDGPELQNFIDNPPNNDIKNLIGKYSQLSGNQKNERIIRLFVVGTIKKHYETNGFTPKFLPVIRYSGLGGTPLLHFAILGIRKELKGGVVQVYQKLADITNQRFLNIESNEFINSSDIFEFEKTTGTDPVKYFTESKTYNKLWVR